MLRGPFPAPDRTVFRIHHLPDVHKTAFPKDAGGSIQFRERMGPDHPDPLVGGCESHERAGGLRRIPPPLDRGHDAVGDLDHSFIIWWPLEPRRADDLAAGSLDQEKAVLPGVDAGRRAQSRQPLGGYLVPDTRTERAELVRHSITVDAYRLVTRLVQRQELARVGGDQRQPGRFENLGIR